MFVSQIVLGHYGRYGNCSNPFATPNLSFWNAVLPMPSTSGLFETNGDLFHVKARPSLHSNFGEHPIVPQSKEQMAQIVSRVLCILGYFVFFCEFRRRTYACFLDGDNGYVDTECFSGRSSWYQHIN
jgi:hypothetical protein